MGEKWNSHLINHCLQAPYHVFKAPDVENWRERIFGSETPQISGNKRGREDGEPQGSVLLLIQ